MIYKRTLLIDLEDVLIKSDWNRKRGWKVFKRPGVEHFLENMSRYYEVVVISSRPRQDVEHIMDKLDPNRQYIHFRLYQEANYLKNGVYYRDLSKLNRDLAKVRIFSFST